MAIGLKEMAAGKVLDIHVSGKLVKDDYKHFVPEAERLIKQHGKIRDIALEMKDFHGWDAGALFGGHQVRPQTLL